MGINRRTPARRAPKLYGDVSRRQRPPFQWRRLLRVFAWAGGAAALAAAGFGPVFRVRNVQVFGAVTVPEAAVRAAIPLGASLFQPRLADFSELRRSQPLLVSVQLSRGFPDTVRVRLQEQPAVLVWLSGGQRYLVDSGGVAAATVSEEQAAALGRSGVPAVRDGRDLPVVQGSPLVGPAFTRFMQALPAELKSALPADAPASYQVGDSTYDLEIIFTSGGRALFSTERDAAVQARKLARVRAARGGAPGTVDLRVDRWAYASGG